MTPELTAALARAKAVAKRVLAHYGEEAQRWKASEEEHERCAALYRLRAERAIEKRFDINTGEVDPARRRYLEETADHYLAACAVLDARLELRSDEFTDCELAEAIDRKAAAMEARMDRIDAEKEKTDEDRKGRG